MIKEVSFLCEGCGQVQAKRGNEGGVLCGYCKHKQRKEEFKLQEERRRNEQLPVPSGSDSDVEEVERYEKIYLLHTFEWDEELETQQVTVLQKQMYSHGTARLQDEEGLLADTGAVGSVTGMDFVKRQSTDSSKHGFTTEWEELERVQLMSGVGDNTKSCTHQATVYGILENGEVIKYAAPVIPGDPSPVPPLYGLASMAKENTYFDTRGGRLCMVPDEMEKQIKWPTGTRFIQMKKASSGHWLIPISNWKVPRKTTVVKTFMINPQE